MKENTSVDLALFKERHLAALEMDQPKFNLILGLLKSAEKPNKDVRLWSFGGGTRCALQTPPHFIVLGELEAEDFSILGKEVTSLDFLGCFGPGQVAKHFASALSKVGIELILGMPQTCLVLESPPVFPLAKGRARKLLPTDIETFTDWVIAFHTDAALAEKPPSREAIAQSAFAHPIYFWEVDGKIVSMASINRETKDGANISLVYTPSELRGRGYAGSITAYAAERILESGKSIAFLYADARNPISNRVYEKIGFKPKSQATTYVRVSP